MEQHAVPQDITGFKFKLVGDMTLKQFGELAFGAIMAWLFFSSGLHPIIKWPLVLFFIALGVGLAFVPIQERPLDSWIINFFKAIYKPTYFTWKKNNQMHEAKPPEVRQGFVPLTPDVSTTPLMAANNIVDKPVIAAMAKPGVSSEEVKSGLVIEDVPNAPQPAAHEDLGLTMSRPMQQTQPVNPTPMPQPTMTPPPIVNKPEPEAQPETQPTIENHNTQTQGAAGMVSIDQLLKQRQDTAPTNVSGETPAMTIEDLMKQREHTSAATAEKSANDLVTAETKLNTLSEKNKELMMKVDLIRDQIYNISAAGGDATKLQPELDKLMDEKAKVYADVGKAREEMTIQKVAPLSTPAYKEPAVAAPVPRPKPDTTPFPLTSLPNVMNGIVTDVSGMPIDGVIITVKDAQGNSIRALRTSRMGQFIASTPLADGEYYLELEKTNRVFDVWKINLNGTILQPVQIRAKEEPVAAK